MLDKCRAEISGTPGEYHYNCPLDQNFLEFTGINPEALKAEVAKGLGDGEILAWIMANAPLKHSEWEIAQWSIFRAASPRTMEDVLSSANKSPRAAEKRVRTSAHFSTISTLMTT
jgi:hypothetical protein